jgi:hypothetical protein
MMRSTQRSCSRWFGGAWRLGSLTPNRGWLLSALALLTLLLTLSFTAASSQAAQAPVGHQEAPVELEEGEPPGEQEAPPTEAERQNPTQPVTTLHEVPSLRSETSDTYLLSDGAYSQRIATTPINFKAGDGSWTPIEDQLVEQGNGTWQPQAAPVPVSLPASLASGPVSLGPANQQLSFELEGASGQEGDPAGASRVYDDALPETDVTYALTPQALRETLTLANAQAPSSFSYHLNLASGLHATQQQDGTILIENAQGQTVYTLSPPSASDANPDHPFPTREPVHYELSQDGSTLTLSIDKSWLEDPNRVFPVKIDPEAWLKTEPDCPIISAGYANTDECGGDLYVGPDYPTASEGIARSMLYFTTSCIPKGSVLVGSSLHLHFDWHKGSSTINVEAHALEQSFAWGATWNKYDGTHSWKTPGGDFKKVAAGERTVKPEEEGKEIQIGFTPAVEQWVRDPESNDGILLKAQNESVAGYDAFAQPGNAEHLPEPTLEVIYEPRLGVPPMGQLYQQPLANGATLGVNVANGNLYLNSPDVNYATEGYDTGLGRSYNSQDDLLEGASMGNWRLTKGDDTKTYGDEWDGAVDFYGPDGGDTRFDRAPWADGHPAAGDKAFTGEAGYNATLVQHEDGSRTLTYPGNIEYRFDKKLWGVPTEVVDPNGEGNTMTLSYYYDSHGEHLDELKDTHGHTLKLTHEAETERVTKIEGKKGEDWKYTYKEGQLITVTNPAKEKDKYTYYKSGTESGLLESIADSSGTWVVSYDEHKRVSSLRKLVNGTVKKAGSEDEITSFSYETDQTTVTNPDGGTPVYYYDQFGNALEDPELQASASEFYANYAELSLVSATEDIELEDHASILDSQLNQQLGSNYTGEWLDSKTGKVMIGITKEGYERTVETDLDNLGLSDDAEIVTEPASWESLSAASSSLNATLHTLRDSGLVTVGIDSSRDAVLVREASTLTGAQESEVASAAGALSVPHEIQKTSLSALGVVPAISNCNKTEGTCDEPLRGGQTIDIGGAEGGSCSAGFITQSTHATAKYLLTAGHCVRSEFGKRTWEAEDSTGKEHVIGKGRSWAWGELHELESHKGDYGLISIENGYWSNGFSAFWPWVVVWPSKEAETTYNKEYAITTIQPGNELKQKFVVCAGGVGGGKGEELRPREDCGEVVQSRLFVKYDEDKANHEPEVKNVGPTIEVNLCAKGTKGNLREGNSGSPVYKGHVAYGIFTAVIDEVSEPNHCFGEIQPIAEAETALHVHVITGITSGQ